MGGRAEKDALFDGLAAVAGALGNGRRAEIVDLLAQGERGVDEIAAEIGQSVANTSQHLRRLLGAGLVVSRRDGVRIRYSLAGEDVARLWASLRAVAARRSAAIDALAAAYLGDRAGIDEVSAEDLARRIDAGEVVVLDVRPAAEYAAGHVAGALSAPPGEVEEIARGLDPRREVVAYCRGPYCAYADDAVRGLTARGFRASRLADGFPEWRRAGLAVDGS